MAYFTPACFAFLRDLKRHNDRDWFAANRERYVADVEQPLLAFIGDFAPRLKAISPAYVADKRRMGGSMFRIHRDTRFSPDKSPFKTWTAARFPHEARRKVKSVPSFYVHLGPGASFGGGGVYPHLDDLKRQNLYTLTEFTEADVIADDFLDRFTAACERAAPLVKFQTDALGLRW